MEKPRDDKDEQKAIRGLRAAEFGEAVFGCALWLLFFLWVFDVI